MSDERIDVQELLGLSESEVDEQVDDLERLNRLLNDVGQADPRILAAVGRENAAAASDVAIDPESTDGRLRGALSRMVFLTTLLAKRVQLDNPDRRVIDPREVH